MDARRSRAAAAREDDLRRNVLNVVLPDDAVETGEEHEWAVFVERLAATGIEVGDRLSAAVRSR